MKTNQLMSAGTYLMTANTQRPAEDDQPTELGQRILDRMAARQAAKEAARRLAALAAYHAEAAGIPAQKVSMTA